MSLKPVSCLCGGSPSVDWHGISYHFGNEFQTLMVSCNLCDADCSLNIKVEDDMDSSKIENKLVSFWNELNSGGG